MFEEEPQLITEFRYNGLLCDPLLMKLIVEKKERSILSIVDHDLYLTEKCKQQEEDYDILAKENDKLEDKIHLMEKKIEKLTDIVGYYSSIIMSVSRFASIASSHVCSSSTIDEILLTPNAFHTPVYYIDEEDLQKTFDLSRRITRRAPRIGRK